MTKNDFEEVNRTWQGMYHYFCEHKQYLFTFIHPLFLLEIVFCNNLTENRPKPFNSLCNEELTNKNYCMVFRNNLTKIRPKPYNSLCNEELTNKNYCMKFRNNLIKNRPKPYNSL